MFEIDRQQFGGFVAELRRQKGYTQKDLAQRLFISDKAVSKWETGVSIPDVALLIPLAEALGVTVTELLEGRKRAPEEPLPPQQAEELVRAALTYPHEQQPDIRLGKRIALLAGAVLLAGLECWLFFFLPGSPLPPINLWTYEGLYFLFAGYFLLFVPRALPRYYDENSIGQFSHGFFRMNIPGLSFHNGNWPHIVTAVRVSLLCGMVLFPAVLYVMTRWLSGSLAIWQLPIQLFLVLGGLFVPIYLVGKKYE